MSSSRERTIRLSRLSFAVGSVIFLAIGALHLLTQVTVLSSSAVRASYRAGGPIEVNGTLADGWELFAGTSVLMGVAMMAIGALNLAGLNQQPATLGPPRAMAVVTVLVLVGVVIVGVMYLTAAQVVGGSIGIGLFGGPLLAMGGSGGDGGEVAA